MGEKSVAVLARVGAAHGIRGWVRVQSFTDPPDALCQYRHWRLRLVDGTVRELELAECNWDGHSLRVALGGIDDRNGAESLRGALVEMDREELPAAGAREYYQDDLVGCQVVNREGLLLGTVSHFIDAPAQPVMVVVGEREHLIAAVPPHLHRVDLAGRRVEVDWPADL